ncbi:hypothetical protein [Nocardia wallacei]|uniref:hypothetical protein n=1 Tax=Nocardia wallacei TaxID=480035 RepID=UPI0024558C8D|nr:hypothetical protein [Nocardia wallacei]
MLDVESALVEGVSLEFAPVDQFLYRALVAADGGPHGGDRVVGLTRRQRGQYVAHDGVGVLVDGAECLGEAVPGIGEAPHRGLVALRPISGADYVFRDPLQ